MGDREASTIGMVATLNGDHCRIAFADQQARNVVPQVQVNDLQAEPLRDPLDVNRRLREPEGLGKGFALISCSAETHTFFLGLGLEDDGATPSFFSSGA